MNNELKEILEELIFAPTESGIVADKKTWDKRITKAIKQIKQYYLALLPKEVRVSTNRAVKGYDSLTKEDITYTEAWDAAIIKSKRNINE